MKWMNALMKEWFHIVNNNKMKLVPNVKMNITWLKIFVVGRINSTSIKIVIQLSWLKIAAILIYKKNVFFVKLDIICIKIWPVFVVYLEHILMEISVSKFHLIIVLRLIITYSVHCVLINLHYKITSVVLLVSKNKMDNVISLWIIVFFFHKMINVWIVKMDITCMWLIITYPNVVKISTILIQIL